MLNFDTMTHFDEIINKYCCFWCLDLDIFHTNLSQLKPCLVSFNRYLMLAKHFRWTVYMLKYDIMTHLNEFLMLFLVFELGHFPH